MSSEIGYIIKFDILIDIFSINHSTRIRKKTILGKVRVTWIWAGIIISESFINVIE